MTDMSWLKDEHIEPLEKYFFKRHGKQRVDK